jgi:hypothetical protein
MTKKTKPRMLAVSVRTKKTKPRMLAVSVRTKKTKPRMLAVPVRRLPARTRTIVVPVTHNVQAIEEALPPRGKRQTKKIKKLAEIEARSLALRIPGSTVTIVVEIDGERIEVVHGVELRK